MSLLQSWRAGLGPKVVSPLPSSSLKAEVPHVPGMGGGGLLQKTLPWSPLLPMAQTARPHRGALAWFGFEDHVLESPQITQGTKTLSKA